MNVKPQDRVQFPPLGRATRVGRPLRREDARDYRGGMNTTTRAAAPLLRTEIGDVLRTIRQAQGRTLREVSSEAQVSLGYLSEVERGQKEASSELLQAICGALGVPLWMVLREVADRLAEVEGVDVPDTVPDDLMPAPAL